MALFPLFASHYPLFIQSNVVDSHDFTAIKVQISTELFKAVHNHHRHHHHCRPHHQRQVFWSLDSNIKSSNKTAKLRDIPRIKCRRIPPLKNVSICAIPTHFFSPTFFLMLCCYADKIKMNQAMKTSKWWMFYGRFFISHLLCFGLLPGAGNS